MHQGTRWSDTSDDLWAMSNWVQHFPHRTYLRAELALLERLFPVDWRRHTLGHPKCKHQLRGDLQTIGGRCRLLALSAELSTMINQSARAPIPMQGRLRCWSLYEPTKSELLVGPILRPVGNVIWQPEGAGHGADYQVTTRSAAYVAEVKRLCTSIRQERAAMARVVADMKRSGPVFAAPERIQNAEEDARRLYRRVRYAAKQLEQSARKAARRFGRSAGAVRGMLFLDLDGNPYLGNVLGSLQEWMQLPWACAIDLVLFFDHGCRNNVWGTIAEPVYSRTGRALETLLHVLPSCTRGHFHIGNLPANHCEFPLPL